MDFNTSMNYLQHPTVSEKSKRIGATLLGGMLGMACYYLPVSKDTFVNEAFRVTKRNAEKDIQALSTAAEEFSKHKLTNESKILLHRLNVTESFEAIKEKCKALTESVTDSDRVKALKKDFADNFKRYKKDASLMDSVTAKAMSNIKWNGFKWGMGIGAALGAALSMLTAKDK